MGLYQPLTDIVKPLQYLRHRLKHNVKYIDFGYTKTIHLLFFLWLLNSSEELGQTHKRKVCP